jgi:hypothetical protein
MVSPAEVPQHEPPPLQVPVLSSQDSPEQTACAEGIHAAALSTSEALNKVLCIDVFISIAPRPSGCATGHPSPPRTLGLAATDSFRRDRPALTCATSLRLARKLAQ